MAQEEKCIKEETPEISFKNTKKTTIRGHQKRAVMYLRKKTQTALTVLGPWTPSLQKSEK